MNTVLWQVVIALVMLCSLAYVFAFRPYNIRVNCMKQATVQYATISGTEDREVKIEVANQECLLRNGLY